ncbi:hypothetical protein LCGC14_2851370 [marine sediment metagenome]|uniref:Uncharacterized protein n=1 Tax=marine sediment metagenome TaxID=412755 RepID=A0A0F8Y8F7_9ZZZZ
MKYLLLLALSGCVQHTVNVDAQGCDVDIDVVVECRING